MEEELRLPDNMGVPAETALKWQSKELHKLQNIIRQKKKTIERLRHNIDIILKDPELRRELAREILLKERARENTALQKELHRVRASERKILQTLLTYKLKEQDEQ